MNCQIWTPVKYRLRLYHLKSITLLAGSSSTCDFSSFSEIVYQSLFIHAFTVNVHLITVYHSIQLLIVNNFFKRIWNFGNSDPLLQIKINIIEIRIGVISQSFKFSITLLTQNKNKLNKSNRLSFVDFIAIDNHTKDNSFISINLVNIKEMLLKKVW